MERSVEHPRAPLPRWAVAARAAGAGLIAGIAAAVIGKVEPGCGSEASCYYAFALWPYLAMAAAVLAAGLVGGLAARWLGLPRAWLVAVIAPVAGLLALRTVGLLEIAKELPLTPAVLVVTVVMFVVTALLAAPVTRFRWAGLAVRGLAIGLAIVLIPLPDLVSRNRDVTARAAEFAALDVALLMVELAGHRPGRAHVIGGNRAHLEIRLDPVDPAKRQEQVTVTVHEAPPAADCEVLRSRPGLLKDLRPGTPCRPAGAGQWVFDDPTAPTVALTRGDALVVLRSSGHVSAQALLAARIRPTTARELAEVD